MRLLKQLKSSYNKRSGLPRGFTEVEYLESTGTQYIDTGVLPVNDMEFECKFTFTSLVSTNLTIVGSRDGEKRCQPIGAYNNKWSASIGGSYDANGTSVSANTPYIIKSTIINGQTIITNVNGSQASTCTSTTGLPSQELYIFARKFYGNTDPADSKVNGKLYFLKIKANGVLVRDFIPALDANDVPCMYDRVTKTAYYNAGTGEFGIGRKIYGIEYLETTGTQYIDTGVREDTTCILNMQATQTTNITQVVLVNNPEGTRTKWFGTAGNTNYYSVGGSSGVSSVSATTRKECVITFTDMYSTASGSVSFYFKDDPANVYTRSDTVSGGITLTNICVGSSVPLYPSYVKLFWLKIYNTSNVLIRDYYPVKDENDIGYMYDKISHTLYANAGTDNFILGNDKEQWDNTSKIAFVEEYKGKLPRKYTEVEYLEATGTQWIDTGLLSTANSKVDITYSFSSMESGVPNNCAIFGGRNDTTKNTFTFFKIASGNPQYFRFDYNQQETVGTVNDLTWNNTSKYRFAYNGTTATTSNITTGESTSLNVNPGSTFTSSPIIVFGVNTSDRAELFMSGRIYKFWYTDGTTIIDLIPVLDETGKPCMYDRVSGNVYYNQGTGDDFNYGPKIKPVEYIESSGTQYIDTGYIPTNTTGQYAKMQYSTVNNGVTFGSMVSGNGTVGPYFATNSGSYWWTRWGSAEPKIEASSPTTSDTYELYLNFNNDRVAKANDIIISNSLGNISGNYPSLTLFRRNFSGGYAYLSGKIYKYQITEGTDLVRDFIPVIDENNTGYMFDKITHTLYANAGTGVFTHGNLVRSYTLRLFKERDDIPTTYKRVSYLQSTGTQYIDTGYIASDSSGFSVNIMPLQASDNYFIGSRPRTITNDRWLAGSNAGPQVYIGWNTNNYVNWTLNEKHIVQNNFLNSRAKVLDGTVVAQISETLSSQGSRTAYLFSANDASATSRDTCRIYKAQISNENTLVRDFIPVIRKSDNKPGMWDKVTRTFYTNAGSGEFNYGE